MQTTQNKHAKAKAKAPPGREILPVAPEAPEAPKVAPELTATPDYHALRLARMERTAARIMEAFHANKGTDFAFMIGEIYRSEVARQKWGTVDGARVVTSWLMRESAAREAGQKRSDFDKRAWRTVRAFIAAGLAESAALEGDAYAYRLNKGDHEAREEVSRAKRDRALASNAARHRRAIKREAEAEALEGLTTAEAAEVLDRRRFDGLMNVARKHGENGNIRAQKAALGRAEALGNVYGWSID